MLLSRKCILPGCDNLHNSWLFEGERYLTVEMEAAAFPRVGVVSAPPADTPPTFESREYGLFFQDFDNLI